MEIKCLECRKPVPQTPGKRAKTYCNNTCRVSYWKKQKQTTSGIEKRKPGRPAKRQKSENDIKSPETTTSFTRTPPPTPTLQQLTGPVSKEFMDDFDRMMWEAQQEILNRKNK